MDGLQLIPLLPTFSAMDTDGFSTTFLASLSKVLRAFSFYQSTTHQNKTNKATKKVHQKKEESEQANKRWN